VPNSCGFLAFSPTRDKVLALVNGLSYFVFVFNGSDSLAVTGRDKDATKTTQPAPSIPTEGAPIDEWCASSAADLWSDYVAARAATRDLADVHRYIPTALRDDEWHRITVRNEARAALSVLLADRSERGEIEVWARSGSRIEDSRLIPSSAVRVLEFDYEQRTASAEGLPLLYDVSVRQAAAAAVAAIASVQWAIVTTRRLRNERKIPEGVTKAELGRLLQIEAQKAVKAGQISHALRASYLEDQLAPWGIWPLSSFK
jgi:hypothetical protein